MLDANDHIVEIVRTAWQLGGLRDLADLKLRRWAHTLGYRGHWSTKSRHYSTTLGALRDERRQFAKHRNGEPEHERGRVARRLALRRHRPPDRSRRLARRLRREPAPDRTPDRPRGADDEGGTSVSTTKIEPLLLRVDEAAEALALSRTKVYELMASGELESVKLGRSRRVPTAALADFLEVSRRARATKSGDTATIAAGAHLTSLSP